MEEKNLSQDEVFTIGGDFPIEPMFNKVVITLNLDVPDNHLELSDNTMSENQFIVAKGAHVHGLEIGMQVILDLEKMMVRERNPENSDELLTRIKIDPLFIDGRQYGIIEDRMVKAKYIK